MHILYSLQLSDPLCQRLYLFHSSWCLCSNYRFSTSFPRAGSAVPIRWLSTSWLFHHRPDKPARLLTLQSVPLLSLTTRCHSPSWIDFRKYRRGCWVFLLMRYSSFSVCFFAVLYILIIHSYWCCAKIVMREKRGGRFPVLCW